MDNASTDGTAEAVREGLPTVRLVALDRNIGCAARNVAAQTTDAELVAFSDDDSWWAPGALASAARCFAAHPRLGLLAARILVGPQERLDPTCAQMRNSPLPARADLPGRPILGFVACGAVVRRAAFLAAGGFCDEFLIGAEEDLLAWDLAAGGWDLAYVDDVVAHHHPSPVRDASARRRRTIRNDLWTTWLRRPLGTAVRHTAATATAATRDPANRSGLLDALRHGGWVLARRRRLPGPVEARLRLLDRASG